MGSTDGSFQTDTTVPNFQEGWCCDAIDSSEGCANECTKGAAFCMGGTTNSDDPASDTGNYIGNRQMYPFLMPADADNCPSGNDVEIKLTATGDSGQQTVKFDFDGSVAESERRNWNCKWKASAEALTTVAIGGTTIENRENNGWLKVQVVAIGFDDTVLLVMQPPEIFLDYNHRSETNDPEK